MPKAFLPKRRKREPRHEAKRMPEVCDRMVRRAVNRDLKQCSRWQPDHWPDHVRD